MKLNKLLCLLLALCMVLSLCACATQEKITVPKEETTEDPVETTPNTEEVETTEAPTQASEETEPTSTADAALAEALIGTWDWEQRLCHI